MLPIPLLEFDCAGPRLADEAADDDVPSGLANEGNVLLEVTVTSAAGLGAPE